MASDHLTPEQRRRHPIAARAFDVVEPVTKQYLVVKGFVAHPADADRFIDQLLQRPRLRDVLQVLRRR